MAISTIKAGLDDISKIIRNERQAMANSKSRIGTGHGTLVALPTTFADVVAEINALPSDGTIFEQLCKDELARLTTEFQALRNEANTAITALSTITEF